MAKMALLLLYIFCAYTYTYSCACKCVCMHVAYESQGHVSSLITLKWPLIDPGAHCLARSNGQQALERPCLYFFSAGILCALCYSRLFFLNTSANFRYLFLHRYDKYFICRDIFSAFKC